MKKIKFGVQVFILLVSFPVLFLSGISSTGQKAFTPVIQGGDSIIVKQIIPAENCFCKVEPASSVELMQEAILKN